MTYVLVVVDLLSHRAERDRVAPLAIDYLKQQPAVPRLLKKLEHLVAFLVVGQKRDLWEVGGDERTARVRSFAVLGTTAKVVRDSDPAVPREPRQRLVTSANHHGTIRRLVAGLDALERLAKRTLEVIRL